jgi:tetratricopeptide (TPR) repeat protein
MRYFKNNPISILVFSSLLLCTIALDIGAAESDIKDYGGLAKKYPHQSEVHKIFARVQKAAIHNNRITRSKLHIVNGRPNLGRFIAIALPDGDIVLSKHVLKKMIYKNVPEKQGNVRLAFILGHELAHVVHGDVLPKAFSGFSSSKNKAAAREKERQADEQGFLYAAMAGYAVDELLREKGGTFFENWIKATDAKRGLKTSHPSAQGIKATDAKQGPKTSHPSAKDRAKALYERLQNLLDNLPYFHFGVRLAHFGLCDEAFDFFQAFEKVFPAREVYNNLGGCKLLEAQKLLEEEAYSYWLVPMLDVATQIDHFELPSAPKGKPQRNTLALEALHEANEYFELALERDNSYVPAYVNSAITLFYLGKMNEARQAIAKAQESAPNHLQIQSLQAVIQYQTDKQLSIQKLNHLAKQPNVPLNVLYNIAQLLERTRAKTLWQKLAQQATVLPDGIRTIVCQKQDCSLQRKQSSSTITWEVPMTPQWQKQNRTTRLSNLYEQIYLHPNGMAEVLALRGTLKMVVLKKLGNMTKQALPAYCGQALHQHRVLQGTLLSCENRWAALVVDGNVKEVWIIYR